LDLHYKIDADTDHVAKFSYYSVTIVNCSATLQSQTSSPNCIHMRMVMTHIMVSVIRMKLMLWSVRLYRRRIAVDDIQQVAALSCENGDSLVCVCSASTADSSWSSVYRRHICVWRHSRSRLPTGRTKKK